MAEILKEWLIERLQTPITWESDAFGNTMKNGFVIADVLLSYHVINDEEYFLIRSGDLYEDVKNNWKYISQWLRSLDIHLNDTELEQIMEGKGSTLLRLFYQLFLNLDRKDRTDFIRQERKMVSGLVEKLGHRFKVEKIPEEKELYVDNLSKPLLNEKLFIEWQRKKAKQVKDTYDYVRHKYNKIVKNIEEKNTPLKVTCSKPAKLSNKEKTDMAKFATKYPCKFENYTYQKLMTLEKQALEQESSISGSEWAQTYMADLQNKMSRKHDSEEFQNHLRHTISTSLWDMSVAEEETKMDSDLGKKVMKLSQFEKQMCTQVMEIKQQARNLYKNKVQAETEFADQRVQQFNQFLDKVKEQIHSEVLEIDFEKQRQQILHKRLYAEKMKRKRQHYYEICYETMLSIVDYSTKYAYFKKLMGSCIPDHYVHEWKALYYKHQPMFDILDPMEDILKEYSEEEEQDPEEEEIIRLELDRQEALNDEEFIDYHNYYDPWILDLLIPNFDPECEDRKYERLGMRVLGHVVYTLLEVKYPYPEALPPADLPQYKAKAILRGLPDRAITLPMQTLLNAQKIHVVRLETAINFCLREFKTELVGLTNIELNFDKFAAATEDENDKELIRLMKVDDDTNYKASEIALAAMLGTIPPNAKQTQTPKTIPEEEIVLSKSAELGRYAYELLGIGDTLTDHLLSAIIVEYLKDQENIDGFVLINYPNSYREAQILEETLLGISPPDDSELYDVGDDIYLEESIKKHRKAEKDRFKDVRLSKIVQNPHKKHIMKPFESYFTCYINLKHTEDILQEPFIWHLTLDNSELIDRFYAVLGLNYSVYFEVIDKEILAQICYYIIGDFLTSLRSWSTLFGENVLESLDFPTSEDKRNKSKLIKADSSFKSREQLQSRQGSKTSKTSGNDLQIVKEASTSLVPEESLQPLEENISICLEEVQIMAGDEDWDYGELPLVELIGVALANCWEEVEKVYIHDITQLFFAKRLQMNCLVPYARYIKDKMEQIITLPSNKQDLVCRFQQEYNDFEMDWRDIHLTKNEWHCRVKELQNKLYQISDERKAHAMRQRQMLINDNWAMEELTTMANTYISCMQTELNRSIMTFQILHDFYFALIKRIPNMDRLSSKDLNKILRDFEDGTKKSSEDKVYKQIKAAFLEMQLKDIEINYTNNPFNLVIDNNVKTACKIIKDTNDSYRSLVAKEYSEIAKIQPAPKKKDENVSEESLNVEEIFKENALKCIEEWTMAINGEMFRASLRLLALQYKCYSDMKLFNDHIFKTFMDIYNDINKYYLNEILSIDRLCKYLQMAIENGRRIPETLILEHDYFVIDPNLLQYPPSVPPVDTETVADKPGSENFKISQLASLRSQFKIVAPTGIMLQKAFIYLLQDFIFFGKESCEGTLFPETWQRIDPEKISKLVFALFGDTVYVDWRDFLIYCLNLRFPTVDELLEARHNLRCMDLESSELINRDKFMEIKFWFEEESEFSDLRLNLIKHFLFELFETDQDLMNYPAFLLAFCKSIDPCEGFASALSMAVGKRTCHVLNECEEVVCKLIKDKQYRDACLACALKCTAQFIDTLINKVINQCEELYITEIQYVPEEKKGKKGEKGGKGDKSDKKAHASQSARLTGKEQGTGKKSQTDPKNKTQSVTNVKTTFICSPCDVEVEEKVELEEKEKVEEEETVEIVINPNIAYAVSQSVIWNVLRICLPWHFVLLPEEPTTPYVNQVTDLLKSLEVDTDNGDIYVCKFLSDPNICVILNEVKKFKAINITSEIYNIFP